MNWLQKQSTLTNLRKKLKIYSGSNCATLIPMHILHISLISDRRERNPLQHTSTGSKLKQGDATLQMTLPLLGFWSKD